MKAEKPNSTSAPRASEAAALVQVGGNLDGAGPEGVSVDKIRDLLFGNQMQDYDRRFANLEERFLQRFKEIEFGNVAQSRRVRVQRKETGELVSRSTARRKRPTRRRR